MPVLTHNPAEVVRTLLIELGLGTDPADEDAWPIFANGEPDTPDSCITVYNTSGVQLGRIQATGEREDDFGIQVRIRAARFSAGYAKADEVAKALDEDVRRAELTIDAADYMVHQFSRTGQVIVAGFAAGSKRRLFTVNSLVTLEELGA